MAAHPELVAIGTGGIEVLGTAFDDSTVSWALVRVDVGAGQFARKKLIAFCCTGSKTPTMQRAHLLAHKNEIMSVMGSTHASFELQEASECTVEAALEKLLAVFASDNITYTPLELKREYERSLQKAKVKNRLRKLKGKMSAFLAISSVSAEARAKQDAQSEATGAHGADGDDNVDVQGHPNLTRLWSSSKEATADDALAELARPTGKYNWAILEPTKFALHNAGMGSMEEMKEWFDADKVMFGVLRLSFGKEPPVTKHTFIHWIGPSVSAVKRGQWNSKFEAAQTEFKKHLTINHFITATDLDDLDLHDLVHDIKRLTYDANDTEVGVTHESVVETAKKRASLNPMVALDDVEHNLKQQETSHLEAVQEEEEEVAQEEESEIVRTNLPPIEEALSMVQARGGQYDWAILQMSAK